MTRPQPPTFSDSFIDEQINLVDVERARSKQILEALAPSVLPRA
jgi:hypothetical protein